MISDFPLGIIHFETNIKISITAMLVGCEGCQAQIETGRIFIRMILITSYLVTVGSVQPLSMLALTPSLQSGFKCNQGFGRKWQNCVRQNLNEDRRLGETNQLRRNVRDNPLDRGSIGRGLCVHTGRDALAEERMHEEVLLALRATGRASSVQVF